MGTDEERQDDKERISISIHLTHLKLLNREQDAQGVSTRSKMIRIILDEYFERHRPVGGMEHVLATIPGGLLGQIRELNERCDASGNRAPLFVDEEDMIREGLRMLLREHYNSR